MHTFSEFYDPHVSIKESVDALSDPSLDHRKNREDVNKIIINLVTRYVADYLGVPAGDIAELKKRAVAAVQKSEQDMMQLMMDIIAKQMGAPEMAQFSQTDKLARESLIDIRATGAIMKEIIFGGEFEVQKRGAFANHFIGMDFGHGTGILMLAISIAARRKEIENILVLGLDISKQAVDNSQRTLSRVLPANQFVVKQGDITDPMCWKLVYDLPLHYVVSETIGPSTPVIEKSGKDWVTKGKRRDVDLSMISHMDMDPFPNVFMNAMRYRPQLEDDVRRGRAAMFPNLIQGNFRPNNAGSTLVLNTSPDRAPLKLSDVGREFRDFEEFAIGNYRRW